MNHAMPPDVRWAAQRSCEVCGGKTAMVAVDHREVMPLNGSRRFQQTKVTPLCEKHRRDGIVTLLSGAVLRGRANLRPDDERSRVLTLPS